MSELSKAYQPAKTEEKIYRVWEKGKYFKPEISPQGKPFSIVMPPPNVTGVLHLGHALENALMDIEIRYQRLKGKKALLIPGTDHAAIATQAKVEKILIKQGIKNPRKELGKKKLLKKIKDYAEESKTTIIKQIKKLGTSCDWDRFAYTFDKQRSKAVNEVFVKMYKDGLIYRGYRAVNWSVKGQSTCSDDELVYTEKKAKLYTFKYSKDFPIAIATTRPETKLGDTAVAVNPGDERYKKYIGQTFTINIGAKEPLNIKVIADEKIDPEFGTGAVGITPAHSLVDYEISQKHNLPVIPVIDTNGRMTTNAGKYKNMKVLEAREKFVEWLKKNSLLIKEEEITHSIGTSDRFGDVVEVVPMTQWWISVNKKIPGKNKSLKDLMREAVKVGHKSNLEQKINIIPEHFNKIYFQWIDNLRDWCISRQIWWGHKIPIWYCQECGEITTSSKKIIECTKCRSKKIKRDEDTLDTWFSSSLWTFSTLNWPDNIDKQGNKKGDLKKFHPTNWIQMGYEILFFWMARMILMSTYVLDEIPFKDVYVHGILRDKKGRKFSKSLGISLDPIEISKQFGTDALRLSLIFGTSAGNDSRFYQEKVEGARNFVNKLWNIARYILITTKQIKPNKKKLVCKTLSDKWLLTKFSQTVSEVSKNLDKYNFSTASEILRKFTWENLADWYLEAAKIEKGKDVILLHILEKLLILWHPFIPFVTEEIWGKLEKEKPLIISSWPKIDKNLVDLKAEKDFDLIREFIINIRNLKAEQKIKPTQVLEIIITTENKSTKTLLVKQKLLIESLAKIKLNLTEQLLKKQEKKAQKFKDLNIFFSV